MRQIKRSHKIIVVVVVEVLGLVLFSEFTMPPILNTSSGHVPSGYSTLYGSNTSFELSGPFANSSYVAWVLGPDQYVSSMNSFSVTITIMKTGQNSSYGESTLSVSKAVYVSQGTPNISKYSITPFFSSNYSGISIGFNSLVKENTTTSATVYVTLVEQSVMGPVHLPGQSITISLPLRFNMTQ